MPTGKICKEALTPALQSFSTQSGKCLSPEKSHKLLARKTREGLAKRDKIELLRPEYPAVLRTEKLPKGSLRTYDPAFVRVENPEVQENTSPDSVEETLIKKKVK